ncbi:cytochrome C biogenesis protein [Methylobacterium sp. DM1]|uniref:Cytochrome C biogenesis protein n=1 Tax=Methylorubrum extorquens TaxID=408 RepID=A0AAX3WM32_METEX|nr:cytochrome C biogenesis protein [Methylobacterium sp. DM1]WHQ72642.1 cytochrome C biogenesis protein [Methylorubrum extorquens]
MLTVYSLGLGAPLVAVVLFLSGFVARLRTLRWLGRTLQVVGGGVMVAIGLLMVTDRMTDVASLIMEAFPALARIG